MLTFSFREGKELLFSEKAVKTGIGLTSLSHETSKGDHLGSTGHFAMFVTLNTSENKRLDTDTNNGCEVSASGRLRIKV